jgi:hypothetical protein
MKAKTVEQLMEMGFQFVGMFSKGGVAVAKKNGKWFHIRRDGTSLYLKTYDYALPYVRGFAVVFEGEESIILNLRGNKVASKSAIIERFMALVLCHLPR